MEYHTANGAPGLKQYREASTLMRSSLSVERYIEKHLAKMRNLLVPRKISALQAFNNASANKEPLHEICCVLRNAQHITARKRLIRPTSILLIVKRTNFARQWARHDIIHQNRATRNGWLPTKIPKANNDEKLSSCRRCWERSSAH